jgi:Protein of unknown function (DUF3179)
MRPSGESPSLNEPPMATAGDFADAPDGPTVLVGLESVSPPRAYPVGVLGRAEVLNDRAGSLPLVVTRCPLAGVITAFDRRVGKRTLTFINSGALWHDTLVIEDCETGTLWSVGTGEALAGPLSGQQLERLPTVITEAECWRLLHPDSLYPVVDLPMTDPLLLSLYRAVPFPAGVSGRRTRDHRYEAKQLVWAVLGTSEAIAFSSDELRGRGGVAVFVEGSPLCIDWDSALDTPEAESRGSPIPVVPVFWFALRSYYTRILALPDPSPAAGIRRAPKTAGAPRARQSG